VTEQLARMAKRRLAILRHAEEITGNVALTCRYYGISRQCFYAWKRRYDAHGLDGLRDRSHRPRSSPNGTRTEVVGKIIYLRQHDHFGPARIAMYLRRYHQVQISSSGVWRILKRPELNRLTHRQHYRTLAEARTAIFAWIAPPVEWEQQHATINPLPSTMAA
jgi:transposase